MKVRISLMVFYSYILMSVASLFLIHRAYEIYFPLFTLLWLLISFSAVLRHKRLDILGLTIPDPSRFMQPFLIAFASLAIPFLMLKPVTHAYGALIELSLSQTPGTYLFLVRPG